MAPSSGLPGGAARTAPAMAAARPGAPPPPPPLLPLLLLLLLPGGRRALEGEYRPGVRVRRTGARATAHGCTHRPGCPRPVGGSARLAVAPRMPGCSRGELAAAPLPALSRPQ